MTGVYVAWLVVAVAVGVVEAGRSTRRAVRRARSRRRLRDWSGASSPEGDPFRWRRPRV